MTAIVCSTHAAELYVSPSGNDKNDGSKDNPLATLEGARDAIRQSPVAQRQKGVTVWLMDGTHVLDRTLELDGRDSGTKDNPVVYRAVEGAKVALMGGIPIAPSAFKPVTDDAILQRLEESARGKVLQYRLPKQHWSGAPEGLPVENQLVSGAMLSMRKPAAELFFNEEALPFSRWPNEGWAKYGNVIDQGSVPRFGEEPDRPGTLEYTGNRPERWTQAERIMIHGYFAWDWFDDVLVVDKLDTAQKRITFTTPHMYGLCANKRYRALGLLEELDQPGEWMIDGASGTLYLYPPENMHEGRFALSLLKAPMIRMNGTRHITFRDLTLEISAGMAVEMVGGTDNLITGCTIRNIGTCGVLMRPSGYEVMDPGSLHQFPKASGDPLKDSRRNGVANCHLYNIGTTAISMIGGDRKTLEPAGHYAVNNHIHHFARRQRANQPAINMNGVGLQAAHNVIHDAPHAGIFYSGNDHVIEYNEITRVTLETSDVGVIYSGRDWTYRGNVVRYNYIHRTGTHDSSAVYFDDSSSSTHVYGNVMYKIGRAVLIGGGRDNIFENNVIVDSGLAVHIDNRSEGWAHECQVHGGDHRMYEKLKAVHHDQPPHSTRYPELARILDETPHKPLGNKVRDNICVRTKWLYGPAHYLTIGNNLVTDEDPGFVDAENGNFNLKNLAAIHARLPGFQPIPFDKIGLQRDA